MRSTAIISASSGRDSLMTRGSLPMPTIYISDRGDDKNDGLSLERPVYSLGRAMKLEGGRNDFSWHFGPRAWKRIHRQLSEKQKAEG
jgi:hypothetical protein